MQPALPLSLLTSHRTAGHSRFRRLALSERRKGGEIGGLEPKEHLNSVARDV